MSSTSTRARLPSNFAPGPPYPGQSDARTVSSSSSTGHPDSPAMSSSAAFSAGGSTYGGGGGGSTADRSRQVSSSSSQQGGQARSGAMSDEERRRIAAVYFEELKDYLTDFLKREPPNARINAREKLTRLSKPQFHELSTDVYDECVRRRTEDQEAVPFLPVKQEFHPKRNQARQKLASLTKNRFKDLASDVYHELQRRNPDFLSNKEAGQEELTESDLQYPPRGASVASNAPDMSRSRSTSVSSNPPLNNPYFPSTLPSSQPPNTRDRSISVSTSNSASQSRHQPNGSVSSMASLSGRSAPLQVVNDGPTTSHSRQASHSRQLSYGRAPGLPANPSIRPPSPPLSHNSHDAGPPSRSHLPKQSVTTSNIVPNKSTMALEEIQVPFSRDSEYIMSDAGDAPPSPGYTDGAGDTYDRASFSSTASRARGLGMAAALGITGETSSGAEDQGKEEVRREYEFKVASLTKKVNTLEGDLERSGRELQEERGGRKRAESDMEIVKEQLSNINNTIKQLREELDDTRGAYARESERVKALEAESRTREANSSSTPATGNIDHELRNQVRDLVTELNSLSLQNDQLQSQTDREREAVAAAKAQTREMEKKWKAAKTELRNLKATSQMFVTAPRNEDHLPASKNGALADIHVTAFQTAVDGLITAARSTSPTSTLGAMKPVIHAIADISQDVEQFEQRSPAQRGDVDMSSLPELKERLTTTLGALTQAAKEYGMSYGLSPISLLDAAASEVAASVVALFKLLGIRRASKDVDYRSELAAMQEAPEDQESDNVNGSNYTFFPSRPTLSRNSSEGSHYDVRDSTITAKPSPPSPPADAGNNYRLTSTSSVGSTSSAFDLERKASLAETDTSSKGSQSGWNGKPSWDSRPSNGFRSPFDQKDADHEDDDEEEGQAWAQLKPYLDKQSNDLVKAIQSLLASVRAGDPATTLRENLSTVIVIGSSIVGVSKDSLPLRAVGEGRRLLRALAQNCDLLSELSEGEDMGKDVRNQIAQTTFELAKNLKSLLAL